MAPQSGPVKARIRWEPSVRRWRVTSPLGTHFFVLWDNAIYFANYFIGTGVHGAPHMYEGE